jgi:hypothetical protein
MLVLVLVALLYRPMKRLLGDVGGGNFVLPCMHVCVWNHYHVCVWNHYGNSGLACRCLLAFHPF